MKIVIAGTGGVGGYYGAMLARAGHTLFFIARGEHLKAIESEGLTVKSFDGDFHIAPECGENSDSFGEADLVLVCFKSYDTADTFDLYAKSVGEGTAVLSLQNGIENEGLLAERFGAGRVMGGISFIGSRVESPGVILHTAYGHIAIGELTGEKSERDGRIGEMFKSAGVKCKVSESIKRDMWGKMVWNVGFNALCAVLDCPAKDAVAFEPTRRIVESAMLEWISVAQARGVELAPELASKNIEATLNGGEVIPSLLHDKRRGRRMEIGAFNLKVAELGEKAGVDTPVNRTLAGIVQGYNRALGF